MSDIEKTKEIIEEYKKNPENYENRKALNEALMDANTIEEAQMLLTAGANIDGSYYVGVPLINAARMGNKELVEFYIKNGADINASSYYDVSNVLCAAVLAESEELVKFLIKEHKELNKFGGSALELAVGRKSKKIIKTLIKAGVSPNEGIREALWDNKIEILNFLINAGANKFSGEDLVEVAKRGQTEVLKVLIKAGVDVNFNDGKAMEYPGVFYSREDYFGKVYEVEDILINAGIKVTEKNIKTWNEVAHRYGYDELVDACITAGINEYNAYRQVHDIFVNKNVKHDYDIKEVDVKQLGKHVIKYRTSYGWGRGTEHILWIENGKLIPLNVPDYFSEDKVLQDSEKEVYISDRWNNILTCFSAKGIKEIKKDLSNLPEKDFLELYCDLAQSREYRDALKERTLDIADKWGDSAKLMPQRMEKYAELVHGEYSYDYKWLLQSPEDKAKLIAQINNDMNDKIEVNENRLSDLKGVSVKDLADGYSETALLAAQVYDCSHLSGLLQVAVEAPNTPAFDLIAARYRETYGSEIVDGITECADEIIKLPYKKMFFETITKDNSNAPEANFLDAFTDKIRDLAMKKYGQEDWYTSISEAAKNPEFMKECDNVWEEMFAEADKYASYRPNEHNNAYIRQMFSDKAEQLHEFVTTQKTGDFAEVLDETIKYHQKVGKMMAAIREYSKDNQVSFNGNLHFDLVDAGIETKKEAKRCLDIWQSANERPDRYGSPYNEYSVRQIAQIAKSNVMQDWMYPVMMDAIEKGGLTISEGRMPSERTLFDCCKAWKINPSMPQRLAKFVGTQSLKGRMLAGAIFDKMVTDGKTTPEEWRDNKVLHEKFYEELARAEKMPREKAFQQYIPNTPVNRKRVIGMGMEEKGIENTPENFKALYREAREQGVFEKMLAKPEEARTTFSSRLLVETARRKAARE